MTTATLPPGWQTWPASEKRRLHAVLARKSMGAWRSEARPEQLPRPAPAAITYVRGGRGSGKSWSSSHMFAEIVADGGDGEWAIVAPTFGDARDTCVEGPSGLLAAFGTTKSKVNAGRSPIVKTWNRSMGLLELHSGATVHCDGADDGAYRIQGKNLRGVWCSELGLWRQWKTAWEESIGYALRISPARLIADGTPKRNLPARELVRQLIEDPTVDNRRLRTVDNLHNLDPVAAERLMATASSALGAQELEGELIDSDMLLFERDKFRIVDDWPRKARLCRFWDMAASEPKPGTDPDWTVGALLGFFQGQTWIIDIQRMQGLPIAVRRRVEATRDEDKQLGRVLVRMEQEPGSSGKTSIDTYRREVFMGGLFDGERATGSKVLRAEPLSVAVSGENVHVVRAAWNKAFLDEIEMFPDATHDDQVDAASGAFNTLTARGSSQARSASVADMQLPSGGLRR